MKSMGVELKARNLAQVSINLTDFEQTPMHRVYEMVKREAERYGAMPVGSEIVGLVPKKAIEMAADFFLQLENFSPAQVFENKLAAALSGAPLRSRKEGNLAELARPFLDAVAEPTATPGGGSVSAFAAALGGGAGADGCRALSQEEIAGRACRQAFRALDALRKDRGRADRSDRPRCCFVRRGDGCVQVAAREHARKSRQRDDAIQAATKGAAEVPLEVAERTVALFERLGQLDAIAAASMKSDLQVARLMAAAGARGALANVEINLDGLKDADICGSDTRKSRGAAKDKLKRRKPRAAQVELSPAPFERSNT